MRMGYARKETEDASQRSAFPLISSKADNHASAIEPTAVTSQEIIEMVPTSASLVGSMGGTFCGEIQRQDL